MKRFAAALATLALAWPAGARAEGLTGTPFVEGLKTSTKILMTRDGNLTVASVESVTCVPGHRRSRMRSRATTFGRCRSSSSSSSSAFGPTRRGFPARSSWRVPRSSTNSPNDTRIAAPLEPGDTIAPGRAARQNAHGR